MRPQVEGDDHLDEYERWARERLTPIIGPLRVVDRSDGPDGLHDFEADLADGSVAAIEVTGEVDGSRRSLAAQAERHLSSLNLASSPSLWSVELAASARVSAIGPLELLALLRDMEAVGRSEADDRGYAADPFVGRLTALGIQSIYAVEAKAGYEGTVLVHPGSFSGWGWNGRAVDNWLHELLNSSRGSNKLGKLARADAAERHLAIVLDSFSKAGLGLPLALRAQRERRAAGYAMPVLTPPEPLTHLWLIPEAIETWEGLHWTRAGGWTVLEAWQPKLIS